MSTNNTVKLFTVLCLFTAFNAIPADAETDQLEQIVKSPSTFAITDLTTWNSEHQLGTDPMFIAMSPTEHIKFKDGKIVRYVSIEKNPGASKAVFTSEVTDLGKAGFEDDYTGIRAFNILDSENKSIELNALTIKINGKIYRIDYVTQEKRYFLRCN